MAAGKQQKHLSSRFSTKAGILKSLEELKNMKVIFILRQGILKIRQCQKTGNFLAYMAAFSLAKCRVTRKL